MNRTKVLIAIESFFDGGAEMFAIRLANELAKNHTIIFLELEPYRSKEKRQMSLLDFKKLSCVQAGKNWLGEWLHAKDKINQRGGLLLKTLKTFYFRSKERQITKIISNKKINVVNSHSWDTDIYFASLKTRVDFRLVSSFHGHYEFLAHKRPEFLVATKCALSVIDEVVYTTPQHEKILDQNLYSLEKRERIFYGSELPIATSITTFTEGERLLLVLVARGIKEKGWEESILSVLTLLEKYQGKVALRLVGEGEYLEQLKSKYKNWAITFSGYATNVKKMIDEAHIGLLPSYYIAESLPNTIIEYLSSGKPVITTNVGAVKEMISTDGQLAGVCLDLKDGVVDVESLTSAIEKYLQNPDLVQAQSAIALKAAEKFSMELCSEKYLKVFNAA